MSEILPMSSSAPDDFQHPLLESVAMSLLLS